MSRIERIGPHTLYLGDSAEILQSVAPVDACVMDPPYGIGESGDNSSRTPIAGRTRLGTKSPVVHWAPSDWDNATADDVVTQAISKAAWSIVFGGNYYSLPPTSCWLVWDKLNGDSDFADCELAWTNLPKAVRRIRFMWNGMLRQNGEQRGDHPTQKPIEVMRWCIGHLPPTVTTVLDPFMGSGTTLVAAAMLGKHGIGIEREEKYFDIAVRRVEAAMNQPDLFIAQPKAKAEQLTLLMEDA